MLLVDIQQALSEVHFITPSLGAVLSGILACALLFVSGFASGSEIAFFSLSPGDINELEDERQDADSGILDLLKNSERTLATILITNNLVNVTIIMLCNYFFASVVNFGNAYWLQFLCVTVLLTFLLLLFGEILPKILCAQSPLKFCRKASGVILFLRKLFYPFASVLLSTGMVAEKVMRKKSHVLSASDLEQALELTDNDDIKEEKKMLEGIVRFGDETVKEIMTSRQDVVDLNFKSSFAEVLRCIVENNYSRIPVYQNSIDNVRGILYIKDLLPHLGKPASFRWQSLIRAPFFVPETKKIDDMLREFQENKVHIAVVVDEFGGMSGIVTLEDVLEEIVGEINDEYDDDEKNYVALGNNTFIFEGKTLLTDFYRIMKVSDDVFDGIDGDADTLAGLLLEIKGEFPKLGEKMSFAGYSFEVCEMDEHRISKVKVVAAK